MSTHLIEEHHIEDVEAMRNNMVSDDAAVLRCNVCGVPFDRASLIRQVNRYHVFDEKSKGVISEMGRTNSADVNPTISEDGKGSAETNKS